MDISSLPAKQKRLKHWSLLLSQVKDSNLQQNLASSLELYKATIARCWKTEHITSEDEMELKDLERRIEKLHELARFAVCGSAVAEHCEK
jgi:hypothetical protein